MKKRTTALVAAGTLALSGAGVAVMTATPAFADAEKHGTCGNGVYEFSVDREDGGFEVQADLDQLTPGAKWKVVLRHDGKVIAKRTLRADAEGDLDLERYRPNTAGKDVFSFTATRGAASCKASITQS